MRISRFHIISAMVLLHVAFSAASRAQDQKSPSQEERRKAINLVRAINVAEVRYYSGTAKGANDGHGRFASWTELYDSGLVKELQVSSGPEIIPGYHLDLLASPDSSALSGHVHGRTQLPAAPNELYGVFGRTARSIGVKRLIGVKRFNKVLQMKEIGRGGGDRTRPPIFKSRDLMALQPPTNFNC
jgi:hypothetical protein